MFSKRTFNSFKFVTLLGTSVESVITNKKSLSSKPVDENTRQPTNLFSSRPFLVRIAVLVLSIFAIYSLWLSLFVSERGVPYSDEAYYFLLAKFPENVLGSVGAPQWIAGGILSAVGSIHYFRLTGMMLLAFSSLLLAFAVCKFMGKQSTNFVIAVMSTSAVGAIAYGAVINFSPSYNLLTAAFGYIAAAVAVIISTRKFERNSLLLLFLGAVLGLVVVSRPTSGAMFGLLCVWYLYPTAKHKIFSAAAIAGGFVSIVASLVFWNSSPSNALDMQFLGRDLYGDVVTTSFKGIVSRYLHDVVDMFLNLLFSYPGSMLILCVYLVKPKKVLVPIAVVVVCLELLRQESWRGGQALFGQMANPVFLFLAISVVYTMKSWFSLIYMRRLVQYCLLMPFALAFGTGNAITTGAMYFLAPWAVVVLLIAFVHFDFSAALSHLFIPLVFSAVLVGQFATSVFRDPYHLPLDYGKQDKSIISATMGKLKVDYLTEMYVTQGANLQLECGWSDDTLFVGAYQNPGLALVLNTKPYGSPWLTNETQLIRILRTNPLDLDVPLVLAQWIGFGGEPYPSEIPNGLDFPGSFRLCGEISYPYANQTSRVYFRDGKELSEQ